MTKIPHTSSNTTIVDTSEKPITLNKDNGWRYSLSDDQDAMQGWSYVIDPESVQEQNADGYEFDSTPEVTTDEEGNVTYTCTNRKLTTVSVEKIWDPAPEQSDAYVDVELHRYVKLRGAFTVRLKDDQNNNPVKGAKFSLYKVVEDGDDIVVQENLETDINGEVSVSNLEPGTYYYKQTGMANGYTYDSNNPPQSESFTVEDNISTRQSKTLTLTNTATDPVGVFTLTLKDNTGVPISGAQFQLYKDGSVFEEKVYTTAEDGVITEDFLLSGRYFLRQISTPSDYKMPVNTDTEVLVVDQPGQNSAKWEIVNTCVGKGDVTVIVTEESGNPVEGAGFTLSNNGITIETGSTDQQGKLIFGNTSKLTAGTYTLEQTSTASGLVKSASRSVIIEDNGDPAQHIQIEITNLGEINSGNITVNLYRAQGAAVDSEGGRANQNTGDPLDQPYATNKYYKPGDIVAVKITTNGASAAYCTDYNVETPPQQQTYYFGTFEKVEFHENEFIFYFTIPLTPTEATYNFACSSGWSKESLNIEFVNPPGNNRNAAKRLSMVRKTVDSVLQKTGNTINDSMDNDEGVQTLSSVTLNIPSGYIEDDSFSKQTARLTASNDESENWKHLFEGLDMTDSDGNPYYYYIVETSCNPAGYFVTAYSDPVKATDEVRNLTVTNELSASPLPATGGPGTMLIYGLGAVVAEITGYNMLCKRRKKYLNGQRHKIMKKRWS